MADIGSDFDGPLKSAAARPSAPSPPRLVAEVDDTNWGDGGQIVWLFADHGSGRLEPVSWPDEWPLDITLDQMRERGVEVRQR